MANKGVSYAIVHALAAYLKSAISQLQEVYDDFPNPSQAQKTPCASVVTGTPQFQGGMSYVLNKTPDLESGKTRVLTAAGTYELKLQLDVWCSNKFERHQLVELVAQAMSPHIEFGGINLALADYQGQFAHYCVTGFAFHDSEHGSQRNSWRVRFEILADVKAVRETLENVIVNVENQFEIADSIPGQQEEQAGLII